MSHFFVSIDIGGTFTDCLVENNLGELQLFKASSTPGEFEKGFMDTLELAAEYFGLTLEAFLKETRRIVHGSTVSTNALVEGKVAVTALFCNAGHPDILTLREAVRKPVFDWRLDYPDAYIPRSRTAEIRGRIIASGAELEPLNEEDVRAATIRFKAQGVEAIGVSYLWSVVNGSHESRTREIIHEIWPNVPITLSHELNPVAREYRRTISTVIDASLRPIVSEYVDDLLSALTAAGYTNDLLLANCVGGMMPPADLVDRPIFSVMSGPTLAPVAAKSLTVRSDVLVVDMGGTTFDVSAIRQGEVIVSSEAYFGSDMLGIPKVDVRSVGAGGGSIAWVDAGGLLRVGPQSAGARPGPACYGRGGVQPTVTDANVVLGIIDPDNFLGGRMHLDEGAAHASVQTIADQLSVSLEEAAYSIYTTGNNIMVGAIGDITVREGINPRDSYLVVGGGATAAHICDIASELGMSNVLIPRFASGLSAYGGLISDIRWSEQATAHVSSVDFSPEKVNEVLKRLSERGLAFLEKAGVPVERQRLRFFFMGRYQYQSWEIEVPFDAPDGLLLESDRQRLVDDFHAMHKRIYSVMIPDDIVEFTTWTVRAIGLTDQRSHAVVAELHEDTLAQATELSPTSHRPVYVRTLGGFVNCPIYSGISLEAGSTITGPAIIEEPTTTILISDGATARIDAAGNCHLELGNALISR